MKKIKNLWLFVFCITCPYVIPLLCTHVGRFGQYYVYLRGDQSCCESKVNFQVTLQWSTSDDEESLICLDMEPMWHK